MADTPFYVYGTGLTDIQATSIITDTLTCDDYNTQSGIANFNYSTLSNVQNVYANNNVFSANITSLSNSHVALSNGHLSLSNAYISYSNLNWKINNSNLYTFSNVCLGTSNATQQLTLTGGIQASNLHTSNLIIYRGSNILDTDQKIDYNKWIKNGPVQTDDNGVIVIPVPIITYVNTSVNTDIGGGGDENHDPSFDSNPIYCHWNNLVYKPVYNNINDLRIGFGSNLYVENKSKIYGINKLELLDYDGGKYRRISSNLVSDDLWYDFDTKTMYLNDIWAYSDVFGSNISACNLYGSNAIFGNITVGTTTSPQLISSNIQVYNIQSSNIITFNMNSSNVNSSNIYSSNLDTRKFVGITGTFSNSLYVLSNILVGSNLTSSNINSSNIYASNMDTKTFVAINGTFSNNLVASNITASNISTNFYIGNSLTSTTGVITTLTSTNVLASNVSSCNIAWLSNNFVSFSNVSLHVNDSNLYTTYGRSLLVATTKSNADEKLEVQGNIKCDNLKATNGLYINNQLIIDQNGRFYGYLYTNQVLRFDAINTQKLDDGVIQSPAIVQQEEPTDDLNYFTNPFSIVF